jgi:hypothetical protein
MSDKTTQKALNEKRSRAARSLKQVNLSQLHKKLINTLNRTADELLDRSYNKQMSKDDIKALVDCIKMMPTLIRQEEIEMESLTDDELKERAKEVEDE